MSKTPIHEAVRVIADFVALQDTVRRQEAAIVQIIERLDRIEHAVDELRKARLP